MVTHCQMAQLTTWGLSSRAGLYDNMTLQVHILYSHILHKPSTAHKPLHIHSAGYLVRVRLPAPRHQKEVALASPYEPRARSKCKAVAADR